MSAKTWGDTLAAMRAGKRNPRVLVKEAVAHVSRAADSLRNTWATSLQTYDTEPGAPGQFANVKWRAKRPDELPENQVERWERLAEYARAIRFTCDELERFARIQAIEVKIRAAGPDRTTDVHTQHCCAWDGCKYGPDHACTVSRKENPLAQSYPCRRCPGQED